MVDRAPTSLQQEIRALALGALAFLGLALLIALPYVTLTYTPSNVVAPARYEVRPAPTGPPDSANQKQPCFESTASPIGRQPV